MKFIEKIEALGVAAFFLKMIAFVAALTVGILLAVYVEENGLKGIVEAIWYGSSGR